MANSEDIVFDSKSGLSVEEQKEILRQINGIAEKYRRSLSQGTGTQQNSGTVIVAKKKELFFPLAVNLAAFLILAVGAFILFFFNGRKDVEIRTGKKGYSMTEQALIGELTATQQEAFLTLEMLARDQERAAGIDAYLSGAIAVVSELLLSDEFDKAAVAVSELKLFLDTPSFELNRTFLTRKEFYVQSINSVEKLIDDIRRSGYSYVMSLETRNSELENTVTHMENTIETLTEGNTEQASRIVQLEDTVTEKDRSIISLETEKNTLTQTVSDLQTVNSQQQSEITQLNDQLTNIRQVLQALSQ